MTDPRGSHMGGAVRDGRQPLPEWRFVCEERRRPDAELLARLDAEDVGDDESARYLVEIRIGRRKPVSGPGRLVPAVQAVYCDEHAERWCYRRPAAEVDSESDLGVALVEDVEDCIRSVMAADPSFGGSPPPGLPPERLRDQAREVLREAHGLDVPEVRTDGGTEKDTIERGEYVVGTHETHFGEVLEHGLSGLCLLMVLPEDGGWRPLTHYYDVGGEEKHQPINACLSHQIYQKKVEAYLERNPLTREVAVVDIDFGNWSTVWTSTGECLADNRFSNPGANRGDSA